MDWTCVVAAASLLLACSGSPGVSSNPPPTCAQQTCVQRRFCSISPAPTTSRDPLQSQLGCSAVYSYNTDGMIGQGSFCPDSPATRAVLRDHAKQAYRPCFCDASPRTDDPACLRVPADQLFVFWHVAFPPPVCPSSCRDDAANALPAPVLL
jgi:hypothetical protein